MGLGSEICFGLSRKMVTKRRSGQAGGNPATFDKEAYQRWRDKELQQQFSDYFSPSDVVGKDVLDFGCGEGELSFLMMSLGAKSVTGIEVDESRYAACAGKVSKDPGSGERFPRFLCATNDTQIDLPDSAVDVIVCFDVLEHIMAYDAIIREWRRVLRPGGRVLIWWVPWWHPYGPHIESLVPIPWCHVLFSDKTLLETCAKVYELPEFKPRIWDLDEHGAKKPNKWRTMQELPEVNKLSMRRFEGLISDIGFEVECKRLRGFGSSSLARLTHLFLHVPGLREFFTSSVVYSLKKA